MLTFFPSQHDLNAPGSVTVIGIGGAGTHILNKLKPLCHEEWKLISLNSDSRLIKESQADINLAIGTSLTRGLSSGGDPDVGRKAAQSSEGEWESHLKSSPLVFLAVGLGGGTGSGAAPVVAKKIRESGAFLVVFATLPFSFEGSRREKQANEALKELALYANILLNFENDRMGELIASEKGVLEAFAAADCLASEAIAALSRISLKPGLLQIGLDDIGAVLGRNMGGCLFGFANASGEGRAKSALSQALASTLLSDRDALARSGDVLVHISGGRDLSMMEIESLMKDLSTHLSDNVHIHMGVSIDEKMEDGLSLIILSGKPSFAAPPRKDEVLIIDDPHLGEEEEDVEEENIIPLPEKMAPASSPLPEEILPEEKKPEPTPSPKAVSRNVPPPTAHRPIIEEELPLPIPGALGEEIRVAIVARQNIPPIPQKTTKEEPEDLTPEPPRRSIQEEQSELEFNRSVKGKFAGDQTDLIDGEDLDLPPALRKKRQS